MNPVRDLLNQTIGVVAIKPQVQTNSDSAIVGEIIDTRGYDSLTFFIVSGAITDADVTTVLLVEDGAASNLSDNVAVADAILLGTAATGQEAAAAFAFGDDTVCHAIGVKVATSRRYVRLTLTPTGNNSGALPIAAVAVLGHGGRRPDLVNLP